MKLCLWCKEEILEETKHYKRKKFCKESCGAKYYRKNKYNHTIYNIAKGTVGTIQELYVTIDLLKKGYEVFKSISPCCSCDLAILKSGKLLKVEVTTGYGVGKIIMHPPKNKDKYDILAVVVNGEIKYEPIQF